MKPVVFGVTLSLFFFGCAPLLSIGSDGAKRLPSGSAQTPFSAGDFDWRDIVPYLFSATALPAEPGLKSVLENSKVLRAYVANEVWAECKPDKNPCPAGGGSVLQEEVRRRIDEIVQKGILHSHKAVTVDYPLARQPFPFSEIEAVENDNGQIAYFMLALSGRSYTAAQLQAKYGDPYDTDIFDRYSVFEYRTVSPDYTSKAVFEIDPVDGAVMKVAISLKTRKAKNHRQ